MERNRLTTKKAGEAGAINDVYTLNGARPTGNVNPADKYEIGGPDQFGETPLSTADTAKLHDKDVKDRDPNTNISNLREAAVSAVRNAAETEKKAMRCLVAAQRMLPGADESVIEATAADLLVNMPTAAVDALLMRQEAFARKIASDAGAVSTDEPVVPTEENKDIVPSAAPAQVDASAAAPATAVTPAPAAVPAEAPAAAPNMDELVNKLASVLMPQLDQLVGQKIAAAAATAKKDEDPEKDDDAFFGKKASADNLDNVFSATAPSASKKGATSLSGMVNKQASSAPATQSLESLWVTAPDVTGLF